MYLQGDEQAMEVLVGGRLGEHCTSFISLFRHNPLASFIIITIPFTGVELVLPAGAAVRIAEDHTSRSLPGDLLAR